MANDRHCRPWHGPWREPAGRECMNCGRLKKAAGEAGMPTGAACMILLAIRNGMFIRRGILNAHALEWILLIPDHGACDFLTRLALPPVGGEEPEVLRTPLEIRWRPASYWKPKGADNADIQKS